MKKFSPGGAFGWLGVILFSVLLAACGQTPRTKAERKMRSVGPEQLRKDAAILYKNLFASAAPAFTALKQDSWPESFRRIGPLSVGAYADGFSLAIEHEGGSEAGLYVVPVQMDLQPASRGRARFDPIAEGIYWYAFAE